MKLKKILLMIIGTSAAFTTIPSSASTVSAEAGSGAREYSYQVVRVQDGDTFIATDGNIKFRVRIAAMDAPESKQAYGKVATYQLGKLLETNKVRIEPVGAGYDQFGRILGKVYVGETDVGLKMVELGLASYYRPKCKDYPESKKKYNYDPREYIQAELAARHSKLAMWGAKDAILPCQFRRVR